MKLVEYLPVIFMVSAISCTYTSKNENVFTKEAIVVMDSLQIDSLRNVYVYVFNGGVPSGLSRHFITVAKSSKEISYETACLNTGCLEGLKIEDDTLTLQVCDNDTTDLPYDCGIPIKLRLPHDLGPNCPPIKAMEYRPYR